MNMKRKYGGAQREMHRTKIKQAVGYLGPNEIIIEVGYEQHMVLQEDRKSGLLGNLKSAGMDIYVLKGKRVCGLRVISRKFLISVTKIIRKGRVK